MAQPVPWQLGVALVSVLMVSGCKAQFAGKPNAADAVRRQNLELEKLVSELQEKLDLRTGELESLREQLQRGAASPMPGAISPTLSKIEFDRYTGAMDTNGDGNDDRLRVYVRTLDQHGRLLPVAGRATLQLVQIEPDTPPILITERSYAPAEWDDSYRSGLTGTHHTLEMLLPDNLLPQALDATVKLTFVEADTGTTLTVQQAVRIDRQP